MSHQHNNLYGLGLWELLPGHKGLYLDLYPRRTKMVWLGLGLGSDLSCSEGSGWAQPSLFPPPFAISPSAGGFRHLRILFVKREGYAMLMKRHGLVGWLGLADACRTRAYCDLWAQPVSTRDRRSAQADLRTLAWRPLLAACVLPARSLFEPIDSTQRSKNSANPIVPIWCIEQSLTTRQRCPHQP